MVRLADGTYSVDALHCTRCGECTEQCPTNGRKLVGEERSVEEVLDEGDSPQKQQAQQLLDSLPS